MFKSRITQFAANLLIVIVLYGNLDLMFQMWGVRIHRDTLPNIWYLENLFYIHAVFTETNVYSREFAAFGVDTRFEEAPAMPDENMIDLNIHQYFHSSAAKQIRPWPWRVIYGIPNGKISPTRLWRITSRVFTMQKIPTDRLNRLSYMLSGGPETKADTINATPNASLDFSDTIDEPDTFNLVTPGSCLVSILVHFRVAGRASVVPNAVWILLADPLDLVGSPCHAVFLPRGDAFSRASGAR